MRKILLVLIALSATAVSQPRVAVQRVRLAEWLSYSLAERKVLPDVSDLKGHKLDSDVSVAIVISKTGDVTGARAFKGDPDLFKKCEEAAMKWHYRPYTLNGFAVEADTAIEFRFTKNKVEVIVPPRH